MQDTSESQQHLHSKIEGPSQKTIAFATWDVPCPAKETVLAMWDSKVPVPVLLPRGALRRDLGALVVTRGCNELVVTRL